VFGVCSFDLCVFDSLFVCLFVCCYLFLSFFFWGVPIRVLHVKLVAIIVCSCPLFWFLLFFVFVFVYVCVCVCVLCVLLHESVTVFFIIFVVVVVVVAVVCVSRLVPLLSFTVPSSGPLWTSGPLVLVSVVLVLFCF
jgi:hypothetical protein